MSSTFTSNYSQYVSSIEKQKSIDQKDKNEQEQSGENSVMEKDTRKRPRSPNTIRKQSDEE